MSNELPIATDQYIQDLLQQLGELEADNAELVDALEKANETVTFTLQKKYNIALIQKHAAK